MSNTATKVMLEAFKQERNPTMFLSGMFRSPPRNFHNSEEVEIDIIRSEEDVSIAVQDLSTGARLNTADLYTNKGFKPPIHKEAAPINAADMMKRQAGMTPFESVDFAANAIAKAVDLGNKLQRKILRAVELQSAQVLTTGVVTLVDATGAAIYSIDYKPKVAHFPTAGVAWNNANSTKLADIQALADVIRADGLVDPDQIIMGEKSFELFISDADVLKRFYQESLAMARIVPLTTMGNGGQFRGTIEIGNYKYEIWTYAGRYKHPQTGVSTKYIPDDKVIVRASSARFDATFGGIPRIGSPDPRIPSALTSRISIPGQMFDMQMNSWITPDGETMMVQAGTRPLMIPTEIDAYGCLDTGI